MAYKQSSVARMCNYIQESSKIVALSHYSGGEEFNTFNEIDVDEMIQVESVNDSDILNYKADPIDDFEEPKSMTENNIYAKLQLWSKLESYFFAIDINSETTLKFQTEF